MNTRRMNRLEELGRVDAEKAFSKKGKRNLRDEKSRIVRELKAKGGTISGNKSQKKKFRPIKNVKPKAAGSKGKYYREFADGGKVKDAKRKSKKIEANKAEYKKMAKDISPDVAMYLKHGKDFPGFDQSRKIRGGLKKGGSALKPVQPNQKGLKKLPTKVRNKMGYMKKGGRVGMGKAMRGGGCVR